jgi:hypothetical protein
MMNAILMPPSEVRQYDRAVLVERLIDLMTDRLDENDR